MLQASDFERELATTSLLYLTRDSEVRVVVLENQAYRFMLIGGSIQSVLRLDDPQTILFAHQKIMLKPLSTLPAGASVLELGLGGGSAVRHASYNGYDFEWTSVEQNSEIVNLYWDYFAPVEDSATKLVHYIELNTVQGYLARLPATRLFELILCDVYDELDYELIRACIGHLTQKGILVVNWLPQMQPQGQNSNPVFAELIKRVYEEDKTELEYESHAVAGFANQIHYLRVVHR